MHGRWKFRVHKYGLIGQNISSFNDAADVFIDDEHLMFRFKNQIELGGRAWTLH